MKYVIPLLIIGLVISTGFSIDHPFDHMNKSINNTMNQMNNTMNQVMNQTHHRIQNQTQRHGEINKTIITPMGSITIIKQNGTMSITINNTNIGKIINIIKNRENRTFIFRLLQSKNINKTLKKEIKIKILKSIKGNITLEREILMNKTILEQFVHPHIKPIVEKAVIKNVTIINNSTIKMKIIVQKKIFGIFPVNMSEEIITNDTYYQEKKPWWSIFAI